MHSLKIGERVHRATAEVNDSPSFKLIVHAVHLLWNTQLRRQVIEMKLQP